MKYIYLDQNKWIELARGLKNKNPLYISLYETIIKNVKEGIWAFPLSVIHISETMKRRKEASRKELLDLMFTVANGYAIYDYMSADIIEFNYWVTNKIVDYSQLKSEIIRHDWAAILGSHSEFEFIGFNNDCLPAELEIIKKQLKEHSCDREFFDLICNTVNDNIEKEEEFFYDCYKNVREEFLSWKNNIKNLKEYKDKHLYPAYLHKMFFESYKKQLINLPPEMKKNVTEIFAKGCKNKTNTIATLESLPGFNVHNRLIFELCNNPDKNVHEHDFNDLAYLRVAIPYCDIVIGEKYWCDRVKNYHLDQKYNTIVNTNLLSLI